MSPLADRVRAALLSCLRAEAGLASARCAVGPEETAPAEASARRARAALGTGEARELLDEAVGTGAIDPSAHGALLAHLVEIAQAEVLARRGLSLDRAADAKLMVDGRERSAGELVRELRRYGRADERAMLRALEQHHADGREARREALAESEERGARILARGPTSPDEAPDGTLERCTRFLAETADAAGEIALRLRHPGGADTRGLAGLLRALAPEVLDPLVAQKTRPRRLGSVFDALGLGRELGRAVRTRPSRLLSVEPRLVVENDGNVTLFPGAVELGMASERAFLAALGHAVARVLVSPAVTLEHRRPPLATAAATLGHLFADAIATPTLLSTLYPASEREHRALRTAAVGATLFETRLACARALSVDRTARGDAEARDRVADALGADPGEVPLDLALPLRESARHDQAHARARLAALALVPALRERYDEDFHRNPRLSDFLRGAAARGGMVSAESLVADAGGTLADAARRAQELVP